MTDQTASALPSDTVTPAAAETPADPTTDITDIMHDVATLVAGLRGIALNWEHGDLAEAVRFALQDAEEIAETHGLPWGEVK